MYKWFTVLGILFLFTGCTNLYSEDIVNDPNDDYLRINNPTKRYFESSEKGISQTGEEQIFYPTETIREITQFLEENQAIKDIQVVTENNKIIVYLQFNRQVTTAYIDELEKDLSKFASDHEILIYTMEDTGENK